MSERLWCGVCSVTLALCVPTISRLLFNSSTVALNKSVLMFQPELPGPPSHVSILVTSTSSLFVAIKEPNSTGLITRYRGNWQQQGPDI